MNIDSSKVIAIGDGDNDLGMLDQQYASHIACPSNATEMVKQQVHAQGGYQAKGEASLGVHEALSYFSHSLFKPKH